MEFFKPTWGKITIALILTIWPYIASYIFALHANDGSIFTDPLVLFGFWEHTWHWSPLYLIVQLFPNAVYNEFWQSNIFLFLLYPLLRFSIRYVVACAVIYFITKLSKKHNKKEVESH